MSRREQLIVVVIVAALALAGFWIGVLSPKLKESKRLGQTLAAAQTRRAQAQAAVLSAQSAQASYVSNVTTISSLTPAIPPLDAAPTLLREIYTAARKANVDFAAISLASTGSSTPPASTAPPATNVHSVTPAVPPGYSSSSPFGIPSVGYTLSFNGGYLQLQKFLAAMEHFVSVRNGTIVAHGRLIDVQGITVGPRVVSLSVIAYLLSPSDQTPLPVPQNAPVVPPGGERASTPPAPPGKRNTKVAVAGGASS